MTEPTQTVRIEGLSELLAKLNEFGGEVTRKACGHAVSQAGKIVRDKAIANTAAGGSVITGTLLRSYYVAQQRSKKKPYERTAVVGARRGKAYRARGKDAWYFRFVEQGTRSQHGNGKKYLEKAWESTREDARRRITQVLEKEVIRIGNQRAKAQAKAAAAFAASNAISGGGPL
jgi:HK97 gp10 family phage protein